MRNYVSRRRGTSIAAAALSFALVAPLAQPVAHAETTATGIDVHTPTSPTDDATNDTRQAIDADAIKSGRIDRAIQFSNAQGAGEDVVSGRYIQLTKQVGPALTATYDAWDAAPEGLPVYFQWADNDGWTSPIYVAWTHNNIPGAAGSGGDGMFAFYVPKVTDGAGKEHHFRAMASQTYRLWADPYTNPKTGNRMTVMRSTPSIQSGVYANRASGEGLGEFPGAVGANGNIQRNAVWAMELPTADGNYMKSGNTVVSPVLPNVNPLKLPASDNLDPAKLFKPISGRVWHERNYDKQIIEGPYQTGKEQGAAGYTVYTSFLNPSLIKQYRNEVLSYPRGEQSLLTKQFIEKYNKLGMNPVIYTAGAVTDSEGRYTQAVPRDIYDAMFQGTNATRQSLIYSWVEDPNGEIQTAHTNQFNPVFEVPKLAQQWAGSPTPFEGPNRIYNWNFALMEGYEAEISIDNYGTSADLPGVPKSEKVARIDPATGNFVDGDAEASIHGDLTPTVNEVRWKRNGQIIKVSGKDTCAVVSNTNFGACARMPMQDGTKSGDIYKVELLAQGNVISSDSFVVLGNTPLWNDIEVPAGTPEVKLPNVNPNDPAMPTTSWVRVIDPDLEPGRKQILDDKKRVVDADGTVNSNGSWVSIDQGTSELTFTPNLPANELSKGRRLLIQVFDRSPASVGGAQLIDSALVTYQGADWQFDPVYSAVDTHPGRVAVVEKPKFVDRNGNPAQPELADTDPFKVGESVPGGYIRVESLEELDAAGEFYLDPATGEVRVIALTEDANSTLAFPVNVTYADGTNENTVAPVRVVPFDATVYEGRYAYTPAKLGEPATADAPAFYDNGKKVTAPLAPNNPFSVGQDVPEGYKAVNSKDEANQPGTFFVDPKTGEVTLTPRAEDQNKTIFVPVKVTYADESTNETVAPFEVQLSALRVHALPTVVVPVNEDIIPIPVSVAVNGIDITKSVNKDDITVEGLPAGLEFDKDSLTIKGKPNAVTKDPVTVTVKAKRFGQEDTTSFKISVVEGKTGVGGEVKPVKATDDKHDTGIVVTKPVGTTVEAVDEDGQKITVEIDKDGKVQLTPGTNVDGPIKVTITDTDLPEGKLVVEVPVQNADGSFHGKGEDDNGSDKKPTSVEGTPQEVEPTETEQPTGIKVNFPDADTKVIAKDEDQRLVPVRIDDKGQVQLIPGTNVDGPITVTITDPELPKNTDGETKVTFEVPVKGHKKGNDDNNSDPKPETKTFVTGDVKTVKATDEPQGTGLVVNNPDKDTKVTAKDEDGQIIPVEIDPTTGEIKVTPGTNVDGPIQVTITDPDLPGGAITIEVPVKNTDGTEHKPGVDDNKSDKTFVTGDVKTVEATDQPQGTGLVVKNPDKDTKVTAKDEDGQIIPVEIDPTTGEIKVIPGTNVDGPIQVTITDPDLPGGAITIEVPVKNTDGTEHKPGVDDNNSNAAPKTTVSGDVEKVQPTDEEQLTGLRVNNRDEDTKVSAKDEDGKDIPVRIDDLGNIQVTPGKDVDGPIMVTISDPDLPGGAITIEVPVAGHTKGTDDNNSNKKPTTVDGSNPGTVQPTDDPQKTGIKVENRDEDTRVIGKDEDGKFIPVEINQDGVVVVTPGTNVDGPIEVTIIDPDLQGGETKVKVEVEGHEEGRDDNAAPADTTTTVTGKVNEVQPTDVEQNTGLKVNNPKEETTVSAKDEDGKTIEVKLDKDGNIVVKPGENVDGPIMVTISDPDLPGGSITIEVPVAGHTKGTDDNNSDKKPTGVDQSKVETVQPTDEQQDTGIKVENRDEDTRVIAKDEDGKFIPVVIDGNGNVKVTPGENVDGPIEVTIIDPDLPNGEVTVKVPVEGHTEGKDDNAIPTPTYPTTVDESGVKEVQPSNEPQDTGIVVNNPGVDTTVTATDEDGKTIPVFIDKDGRVVVTPGTNVDGPITVTIIDPDLPGGKATVEVPVAGHTKGKDDNGTAVTPGSATDKVPADGNGHKLDDKVQNPTEGMTGTVTDNNGNLIDGATATVDPNTGEITVTVPKGTEPGEATVTIKDKDGNTVGEVKIEITNQAGEFEPTYTDTKVPAGRSVNTNDPFEGKNAPVAKVDVAKQDAAKDWTFNPVGKSGVINATAPANEQISAAIKETFPNGAEGETDDAKWNNFTEKFKGYAQPEVGVTVTYTDDSTDGAKANFDLVGKDGKSLLDPDGDFDGDGVSNKEEIVRGLDPANSDTDGDGISDGKEIKNGTNPLKVDNFSGNINVDGPVNGTVGKEITPIDVKGEGEGVTVEIKDGKLPDGLKFENGKITGTPTKAGTFKTTVVSKDANGRVLKEREITFVITEAGAKGTNTTATATATTTARQTTVIEPKCIAASVGLGIPLIALIPIGLATQMAIPGLTPVVEQVSLQIERANANIQQQIGIFTPETAVQVAEINARLRAFGLDLATVGAGLALLAAGILSGTIIYEACGPEDSKLMSSDMKLEGSSGKVYKTREATGKLTTSKAAPTTTTTTTTTTPTPTR